MPGDDIYLTKEGFDKLRKELEHIKTVRRRELIKEVGEAREHGDLSENAEFDAAKEAQAMNEQRIAELEDKLFRVKLIDDLDISGDKIYIGATVKLKDLETDEVIERMLVAAEEADYEQGKISLASPIGKGLLGHAVGDVIEIKVPKGILKYEVLEIRR